MREQVSVIEKLISDALTNSLNAQNLADSLLMVTPLMKHPGFREECEWRLVLLPEFAANPVIPKFRARPDLLVPYVDLFFVLPGRTLPVDEVMVGPSNIPELNELAVSRVQNAPPASNIKKSQIPYRI
jgi:hypothetical protein